MEILPPVGPMTIAFRAADARRSETAVGRRITTDRNPTSGERLIPPSFHAQTLPARK